jgi:DNA polymerase III subunit beta
MLDNNLAEIVEIPTPPNTTAANNATATTAAMAAATVAAVNTTVTRLIVAREILLKPLQMVTGVIERRQTMPILSNVMLAVEGNTLKVTGSDSEIELVGKAELDSDSIVENFSSITLPGRKLLDICRTLANNSAIEINCESSGRATLTSGRSRFVLTTLPANDFPLIPEQSNSRTFSINCNILHQLANKTYFAIPHPQQNIRPYLTGMFMEIGDGTIKTVASDGFRLAFNSASFTNDKKYFVQAVIPRKATVELIRVLTETKEENKNATIEVSQGYIKVQGSNFIFTSKLIASKFPNYNNLIPKTGNKHVTINREQLKQALLRINILSHETLRGFRFILENGLLRLTTNNPEHEEAVEELEVEYTDGRLEIAMNINYMQDVLNNIDGESIVITLRDGDSGMLIKNQENASGITSLYVLMPILK